MAINYPEEDPTAQSDTGPAVNTPGLTVQWRARTVVEDVYRMLDQIDAHPRPQPSVQAWAADIRHQADELTTGRKINRDDIPTLEEARDNLAALVRQLGDPTSVIKTPRPGVDAAADGWVLPQIIRAERQRLPEVPRWPWKGIPARRRVQAWTRAWLLLQDEWVNQAAVAKAWQDYLAVAGGLAPVQITDGRAS